MLSPDPGSARETLLRDQAWFLHSHGKRRSPSVNSSRGCPRVAGQPALTGRNVGPQGTRSGARYLHAVTISNRTLVVSAGGERVLAVLNGREPLLLPPGSVLQFGDPLGQLVVTKVGVIVGEEGGVVCVEAEPEPGEYPILSRLDHPTQRAGYLRPVPSQLPQSSGVRPGNG